MDTIMTNLNAAFKIAWLIVGTGVGVVFAMAVWMSVFDFIKSQIFRIK